MVDLGKRLIEIKAMVDHGDYFTMNRARQYGKTTTLRALGRFLQKDYIVLSLDFQKLSSSDFAKESAFTEALAREILKKTALRERMSEEIWNELQTFAYGGEDQAKLALLFACFSKWCGQVEKPIVFLIDEVDSATNNQVFLDFLAQLRGYYIDRDETPTFRSVILAGVYDVKNIKRKFRSEEEHRRNSPWNTHGGNEESGSLLTFDDCPWDQKECTPFDIAADFLVEMSFSAEDIAGMLQEYETDYGTGMDIEEISGLIYAYTSGYPFLVSRICKLLDERIAGRNDYPDKSSAWTKAGVGEAVKMLLSEKNSLFESLTNKIEDYPELRDMIYSLLFTGKGIPYNPLNKSIEAAERFGFIKNLEGNAVISNRIFETVFYNLFLAEEAIGNEMYKAALQEKNHFIRNGRLDMKAALERFVVHFHDLYGNQKESFLEDAGRRYFLLYLKPIINGTGNYYIEAQTRDLERTDIIVDYRGEQFVIELKIWRGNAYNERGEEQLSAYLDYYHLKKGYMLSYNFNKQKQIGVKEIPLREKILVEAVV
ncbi:MAG: AAA-like domain-containing protein [Eubacteriales bacterium]|nr:AAA-like domain-containing protein [Eubacteriales bacterium]